MILLYLLRRDLRISDNVAFSAIASSSRYTKLIPLYVLPPHQIQLSGFLSSPSDEYPYIEARSRLGKFWRTGPCRAKFIAEGLWDLKQNLKQQYNSDLIIRVGPAADIVKGWLNSHELGDEIGGVWMTRDWASEEMDEEKDVETVVNEAREKEKKIVEWKVWDGEEMLIHKYVHPRFGQGVAHQCCSDDLTHPVKSTPDVFTTFRKALEPLKSNIRYPIPPPRSLPPLPDHIPAQSLPFKIPVDFETFLSDLRAPVEDLGLPRQISWPIHVQSAHPFKGGETAAHQRVCHLLASGALSKYKKTRNGMVGEDFSTKLGGYLANGFISARQISAYLSEFEAGQQPAGYEEDGLMQFDGGPGFGQGENEGTKAVRFELLWRDYMRLCMQKFGADLFNVHGFRGWQQKHAGAPKYKSNWLTLSNPEVRRKFTRFQLGETGSSLVDASMRELYLTGYTSNRARQNVASFLAKWLGIDWRLGAEWYECCLVDYDVASNWGNWAYVAGVGNDPRGREQKRGKNIGKNQLDKVVGTDEGRRFNPVKQGFDYDPKGEYVKTWIEELSDINDINVLMQPHKGYDAKRKDSAGVPALRERNLGWVIDPLIRIDYARPRVRN